MDGQSDRITSVPLLMIVILIFFFLFLGLLCPFCYTDQSVTINLGRFLTIRDQKQMHL